MNNRAKLIVILCLGLLLVGCSSLKPPVAQESVDHHKFLTIGGFIIQRGSSSSWMVTSRKDSFCKYVEVCRRVEIKDGMLYFSDGASWELTDYPIIRTKSLGSLWSTGGGKFQFWMLGEYSGIVVYGKISQGKFRTEYYVEHSWKKAKVKPLKRYPIALEFESVDALFLSDDVNSLSDNITAATFLELMEDSDE